MDAATQRRLIALKSPIQAKVDDRPRCEDCGAVLTRVDYESFWDGQDPHDWAKAGLSITPRCCADCAEKED